MFISRRCDLEEVQSRGTSQRLDEHSKRSAQHTRIAYFHDARHQGWRAQCRAERSIWLICQLQFPRISPQANPACRLSSWWAEGQEVHNLQQVRPFGWRLHQEQANGKSLAEIKAAKSKGKICLHAWCDQLRLSFLQAQQVPFPVPETVWVFESRLGDQR